MKTVRIPVKTEDGVAYIRPVRSDVRRADAKEQIPDPAPLIAEKPKEVIDLRRQLVEFWRQNTWLQRALARQGRRKFADRHGLQPPTDEDEVVRGWMAETLRLATLYWVSPEMTDVLMAIAPSMPDVHAAPPVEDAFVVFARPIPGLDSHTGTIIHTAAYLWGEITVRGMPCTEIETFGWRDFMEPTDDGHPVSNKVWQEVMPIKLVLTGGGEWPKQSVTSDFSLITPDTPVMQESMLEDRRLLAAFWQLIDQKLTYTTSDPGDRPAQRRAQRAGLPIDPVRVIKLREIRRVHKSGETEAVDWSHQWMVSAHWRQQWYPSKQRHQAKLILPYRKGPKDKPLIVKHTVRAWVR